MVDKARPEVYAASGHGKFSCQNMCLLRSQVDSRNVVEATSFAQSPCLLDGVCSSHPSVSPHDGVTWGGVTACGMTLVGWKARQLLGSDE
jgi:hypothetical protein